MHEIAPVFLKKTMRIEAFFTLYFLALLVQAFPPQLTELRRQTLDLLGVPERAFLA